MCGIGISSASAMMSIHPQVWSAPEDTAESVHARQLKAALLHNSELGRKEQADRRRQANEDFRKGQEEHRRNRAATFYLNKKEAQMKKRRRVVRQTSWCLFMLAALVYSALGLASTGLFEMAR